MNRSITGRLAVVAATATAAATVLAGTVLAGPALADSVAGHVYEATNAAAGNAVQVFDRGTDGSLTPGALVPTGGLGAGVSLASQGGITRDGDRLLVVNAGDNTVTSFRITGSGLERRDVEPSGGVRPVSVTVHDNLVYVLNAGSDSITGLRLDGGGHLAPIAGSSRALSGTATGAAQVQFSADGDALVVTEKATQHLDTYRVGRGGLATGPTVTVAAGNTPYGFDIDRRGHVVVSEAATGSVSSYQLGARSLSVVTAALADGQAAPCWLVLSKDGRFAYTTNAASGTISSYSVAADGSLTLLAAVAATPGAGPTDVARSGDGRFLFARVRNGSVAAYAISANGSLTSLGVASGATSIGSSGLAAS